MYLILFFQHFYSRTTFSNFFLRYFQFLLWRFCLCFKSTRIYDYPGFIALLKNVITIDPISKWIEDLICVNMHLFLELDFEDVPLMLFQYFFDILSLWINLQIQLWDHRFILRCYWIDIAKLDISDPLIKWYIPFLYHPNSVVVNISTFIVDFDKHIAHITFFLRHLPWKSFGYSNFRLVCHYNFYNLPFTIVNRFRILASDMNVWSLILDIVLINASG